jgi:Ca-activated chloride channel family protein
MNIGSPIGVLFFIVPLLLWMLMLKSQKSSDKVRDKLFGLEVIKAFSQQSKKAGSALFILSFILFGISLVRPQFGYKEIIEEREGQDIIFIVDVSQSMLSRDLSPNRLLRVRFAITDLLSHLRGDRVGLISFAGVSFVESPLTYDYSTFRLFLDDLDPDLIPIAGSNIESALKKVLQIYGDKKSISARGRSVIIFSDGEELSGDILKTIAPLKELGVKVFTVGLGSEIGAPIPTQNGYKKDRTGKVILSKLDREGLENIATATGGAYLGGELTGVQLENFFREQISKDKSQSKISGGVIKVWREYYQFPLFLGLICYFLATLRRKSAFILLFLAISLKPENSFAETLEQAKEYFSLGEFDKALEIYESQSDPKIAKSAQIGSAQSLYKLKRFDEAKAKYQALLSNYGKEQPEILYDLGNTFTQLGEYKEAIKSYESALKLIPGDKETKENLEYVKKLQKDESDNSSSNSSQKGDGGGENSSEQSSASNGGGGEPSSNSSSASASGGAGGQSSESSDGSSGNSNSTGSSENSSQESSSAGAKNGQNSSSTSNSGDGKESASTPSEREEMLYDSVQEDRGALRKYREQKAMEELEERHETPPEKDW